MDKPRLKLNDKEVGLRDLGDGLFEPKNLKVLEELDIPKLDLFLNQILR